MTVLVPIDDTTTSMRALKHAIGYSLATGSKLDIVHVSTEPGEAADLITEAESLLEGMDKRIDGVARVVQPPEAGLSSAATVGEVLVELIADGDYNQVIMGNTGNMDTDAVTLGSVSQHLIRSRRLPVTVVP